MGGKGLIELKRVPLWVGPFNDVLDDMRRKPFAWGDNDCGPAFAGRIVHVLTGVDFSAPYQGRYHDAVSAYRLMRDEGFDDLADLVATKVPEYAHPSEAHVGDIMTLPVDTPFRHALGVLNGERIFALTENGIGSVDRRIADRAFKVG
ncbi:DUF6950 family protein [Rhizobium herbae]|uniref:DUF6950 family protein n=1 Tax=Rhizobium herbae TaxID=508661 RepID=UPI001CB78775|nr:hypothetical protein [Rhizobium herbae]